MIGEPISVNVAKLLITRRLHSLSDHISDMVSGSVIASAFATSHSLTDMPVRQSRCSSLLVPTCSHGP